MRRVCSKPKLRAVVVVLVIITWLIIYRTLKCSVDFYQWKNIHTVDVEQNEFRRGFTGNEKDSDHLKVTMGHISYLPILSSSRPTSDWMSCDDIKELLQEMRNGHTTFFNHSLHENGDAANFVIKQSTIFNVTSEDEVYSYNSVLKEIENLKRLHSLGWRGIPILYGACVTESIAVYVTSKLRGVPLCDGSGVSLECAAGEEMRRSVEKLENRSQASLMWMSKLACYFEQFENHKVFMEEMNGSSFMFSPQTLDIYLVDFNSLIFYGDVRLYSRSSCRRHSECSRPGGELWFGNEMNEIIYHGCEETMGLCLHNFCRGFDSSLHTCGLGRWLMTSLLQYTPTHAYRVLDDVVSCMTRENPEARCSLKSVCETVSKFL